MILKNTIFLTLVTFGQRTGDYSFTLGHLYHTVVKILVFQVVVLLELGLGTIGAVEDKFFLFLFHHSALF